MTHHSTYRISIAVLAALLLGGLALAPAASAHISQWQLRNAHWDLAPGDGDGFALKMDTTEGFDSYGPLEGPFGSITLFMEDGTEIPDLETIAFDVYYAEGGCGGGSPRVQVGVDLDGDGGTDANVHVYAGPAPSYVGCELETWIHEDLTARDDPNWDTAQIGGTFYDDQADAHQLALEAGGGSYEVTRLNLVWDGFWLHGAAETWFDNVQVNDHTLSEPVGTELWCPVTADGGLSACLI